MPIDPATGVDGPGRIGRATHLGDPLTCEQIRVLADGAEVVITWCGGNGPWPHRILVDVAGVRRVENAEASVLLPYDHQSVGQLQQRPLHRVTTGWDDQTRAWYASRPREREHVLYLWDRLRGIPEPVYDDVDLAAAFTLELVDQLLDCVPRLSRTAIEREHLSSVVNAASKEIFGDRWLAMRTPKHADGTPAELAAADTLRQLERQLFDLEWRSYGGLPIVEVHLAHSTVERIAEQRFGDRWRRVVRVSIYPDIARERFSADPPGPGQPVVGLRCLCDPSVPFRDDLLQPPEPDVLAVAGCQTHRARHAYQQYLAPWLGRAHAGRDEP